MSSDRPFCKRIDWEEEKKKRAHLAKAIKRLTNFLRETKKRRYFCCAWSMQECVNLWAWKKTHCDSRDQISFEINRREAGDNKSRSSFADSLYLFLLIRTTAIYISNANMLEKCTRHWVEYSILFIRIILKWWAQSHFEPAKYFHTIS